MSLQILNSDVRSLTKAYRPRKLIALMLPVGSIPCSSAMTSQNLLPIWLPHCPTWRWTISLILSGGKWRFWVEFVFKWGAWLTRLNLLPNHKTRQHSLIDIRSVRRSSPSTGCKKTSSQPSQCCKTSLLLSHFMLQTLPQYFINMLFSQRFDRTQFLVQGDQNCFLGVSHIKTTPFVKKKSCWGPQDTQGH